MAYRISYGKPTKQFYLLLVAVIIIIGVVGWFLWRSPGTSDKLIDTSKYQAVFLTNGQVYFGKLTDMGSEYLRLNDVYYLQTSSDDNKSDNPQNSTDTSNDIKLIKLGSEVHGPEDQMIIVKGLVIFFENIKADGDVGKLIKDIQSTQKSAN
jgi:hypothetical protein